VDKLVETRRERFWNQEAWGRDRWVEAQAARLKAGSRVLDAGAGATKYRPFFKHCRYETQDFCQYQGPLVKYSQPIDYICEITEIPLPDACLDAILCTEVLEHVVDPMAVLAEFSRLLKPGGKLLLTCPTVSYLHMEPYHFYGGFTRYWYEHWLPRRGFIVESITPQGGPGRAAAVYLQGFYAAWKSRETALAFPKRVLSRLCRLILAKVPLLHGLPWLLGKCDPWLPANVICLDLMVEATRSDRGKPERT